MPLEVLYVIGIVALAAAFAYGYMRSRHRDRANDPVREAATKQLYDDPEGYEKGGKARLEREVRPEK